jgi:transcriptional regulator with XRE-family HTH domain
MALKDFREAELKMTQEQLAELLEVSPNEIRKAEKNPDEIPLSLIKKLADKTGKTLDEVTGYERPKIESIKPDDTWSSARFTKETLVDYIGRFTDKWRDAYGDAHSDSYGDLYHKHVEILHTTVRDIVKKPKIAVVGRSDVGKSTLINSLLGSEKMPVSWNPTTSIVVYIKHIDDRPAFIKDDAWIFKRGDEEQGGWNENLLSDEEYCAQWKLAGGGIDILKSYGSHMGEQYREDAVGSAVVFIDSAVLKDCDIMDLPGFGTGHKTETDSVTLQRSQAADILIYMSVANGFMRDEDFVFLRNAIAQLAPIESSDNREVRPLSNLFVAASHASSVNKGNPDALKNILDRGSADCWKSLGDNFWESREKTTGVQYTESLFRSRFFTFDPSLPHLFEEFEKKLKAVIEKLPGIIDEKAKTFVKDFAKDHDVSLDKEIESYNGMVSEKEKYEAMLEEIEQNEPERRNKMQNDRSNMEEKIDTYRSESCSEFADEYNKVISVDSIVKNIDAKNLKNKKDDIAILTSYLSSTLETAYKSVLERKSAKLKTDIDRYINEFETASQNENTASIGVDFTFNAKVAFASGLVGLATLGGLAFWASTLGNLGAYILVAKGVSLLALLGISTGGTAAAIAAVSAIGGPIVLAIGLAVIAAISVILIFGGLWKKDLAKKMVKAYEEKNALAEYKKAIDQFWGETQKAFSAAADNMERDWQKHVSNLRGMLNNYDVDDLLRRIEAAGALKDFFKHLPL